MKGRTGHGQLGIVVEILQLGRRVEANVRNLRRARVVILDDLSDDASLIHLPDNDLASRISGDKSLANLAPFHDLDFAGMALFVVLCPSVPGRGYITAYYHP